MRVLPGERSSTKPLPEDRKAPPSNNDRKAASGERKAASGECSDAPVGTPVPDNKAELPPVIRRAEVVAFALVSLLVICVVAVLYAAKAFFLPITMAFIVGTMYSDNRNPRFARRVNMSRLPFSHRGRSGRPYRPTDFPGTIALCCVGGV